MASKNLEEILLEKKIISEDQLSSLRLESINSGDPIEEILSRRKMATDEQLQQAKAEMLGIPYILIGNKQVPSELLALIPESTAARYNILPFELSKDEA